MCALRLLRKKNHAKSPGRHRILHAPSFWAEYQSYWGQSNVASELRHKVLLVIGIGSSLYDHGDDGAVQCNIGTVHQWIFDAETWLSGPLEKDRLGMAGLQVYCLAILARQIFSIGGDTVWVSIGSLVHRAMQMGLHRDPKHLPPMPVLQAELRRRLWATILDLVVQSSLDASMPPRISLDENDTEPPANVNDDDMDESTAKLLPQPRDTFTSTSAQLALLQSLPIRLRIVESLNNLRSELSYPTALSLTSQLCSALQDHDNLFNTAPFQRSHLDYLTRRFIIPMHYRFSHAASTNPLFQSSVKLSLDAALALIGPSQSDGDGDGDDNPFGRLLVIGGGLYREGLRCATTAITLALLSHLETQRGDGSLHRAPQYRRFLMQVVRDLVGLAERRIRHGETNVKSHFFLSIVLAQVEAVEQGREVEVEVARAARDSLEFCEGLLAARAEGMGANDLPSHAESLADDDAIFGQGGDLQFGSDFDCGIFSANGYLD